MFLRGLVFSIYPHHVINLMIVCMLRVALLPN